MQRKQRTKRKNMLKNERRREIGKICKKRRKNKVKNKNKTKLRMMKANE